MFTEFTGTKLERHLYRLYKKSVNQQNLQVNGGSWIFNAVPAEIAQALKRVYNVKPKTRNSLFANGLAAICSDTGISKVSVTLMVLVADKPTFTIPPFVP